MVGETCPVQGRKRPRRGRGSSEEILPPMEKEENLEVMPFTCK